MARCSTSKDATHGLSSQVLHARDATLGLTGHGAPLKRDATHGLNAFFDSTVR